MFHRLLSPVANNLFLSFLVGFISILVILVLHSASSSHFLGKGEKAGSPRTPAGGFAPCTPLPE
jgi:hypothetical protein